MSGEVSAASGYSEPADEGEGDDGKITLAPLHDFLYLRKAKKTEYEQLQSIYQAERYRCLKGLYIRHG